LARLEWPKMEKVGFSLTGMAWNGGSQFCHDCNGLESRKLLINLLECLGMYEVIFCRTGMAWYRGSRFWPNWNGLETDEQKSIFKKRTKKEANKKTVDNVFKKLSKSCQKVVKKL
jgi:hypothetical protein